jgi:serine/threonine protein phosphatase PrpC
MVTAHGVTHRGNVRTTNEDCWLADEELGFFVVADGMGGHSAGEIASRLAVDAMRGFLGLTKDGDAVTWPYGLDPKLSFNGNRLSTAMKLANRRVFKESETHEEYTGMGTTAVAILIDRQRLSLASVGDSRIYSFMDSRLQQLTRDDSWIAEILLGEPTLDKAALASHPMRNVLTNVIGARESMDVEIRERAIIPGELLLLCSDGVHGFVDDETIASVLGAQASIAEMTERLLRSVLTGEARDNVTALIIRCD